MNTKKGTISFYDNIAEQSFNEWFNNPTLLPTLNHLPESPVVLDLGCGTGGESKRLIKLNAKVIGIDLSEKSIELAKRNVPNAQFHIMDILKMDFEANSFNGILESGVLFHFNEKEQNDILMTIFNILKPNGILYHIIQKVILKVCRKLKSKRKNIKDMQD